MRFAKNRLLIRILGVLVAIEMAVVGFAVQKTVLASPQGVTQETITYSYDAQHEQWVKVVETVQVPLGSGGGRTIIIRVDADNPVKEIIITETLVINPSGTQPLFEINGHDVGGTGKLNIANFVFEDVDAEQLDIDADVVDTLLENVAAEDDELKLDLQVVNVVAVARGGTSSLFIGVDSPKPDIAVPFTIRVKSTPTPDTGVRVDRIRILGPSSGTGSIETLVFQRSSVVGNIKVENVRIKNLVLKNIALDDNF